MWYTRISATNNRIMEKKITKTPQETKSQGEAFGAALHGGDVVALYGDLGSGKTTFVQGLAASLGLKQRIVSPTFLILKTYTLAGAKNHIEMFYHADLYRIASETKEENVGLREILESENSLTVIEWPEKIETLLPQKTKRIRFTYLSDTEREIRYE